MLPGWGRGWYRAQFSSISMSALWKVTGQPRPGRALVRTALAIMLSQLFSCLPPATQARPYSQHRAGRFEPASLSSLLISCSGQKQSCGCMCGPKAMSALAHPQEMK
jgi:hypothetical protein